MKVPKLKLDDIKVPKFYENDKEYWILDNLSIVLKEAHGWANDMEASDDYVLVPAEKGFCVAQKNMFEVFADGSICRCCVDYNAETKLGQITLDSKENLRDILFQGKAKTIKENFDRGNVILQVCQRCLGQRRHKNRWIHYGNMLKFYPSKALKYSFSDRRLLWLKVRHSVTNKCSSFLKR